MVESLLSSNAFAVASAPLRVGKRLILAYHNIVADATAAAIGDRSLHLPLSVFRSQLDVILGLGLPLARLDDPIDDRSPQLVITFDDACYGAVSHALPELAQRGLPATIFVAPGMLGLRTPWWDRLSDPETGAMSQLVRERALSAYRGFHGSILHHATAERWLVHPEYEALRIATADELGHALDADDRLSLGAHSWNHPNLALLTREELQVELENPLQWLRERWPARTVAWLAYPYGLHSLSVAEAAARAGYRGALLVRGGWHGASVNSLMTPRFNVSAGLSIAGFRSRLHGFLSS